MGNISEFFGGEKSPKGDTPHKKEIFYCNFFLKTITKIGLF
jgi:hypothetical protein